MKTTWLRAIARTTLAILMLATFAQVWVSAQDKGNQEQSDEQTQDDSSNRRRNARALEGTWDAQVMIRNCQTGEVIRTFASIGTFMSGGTMLDSTSGIPQAQRTPGHGVWRHISGRTYLFKFKSFSFDPSGNPTGWTIITHEATLNRHATEYESAGTAEVYNPNGTLIFTGCSSTTATRFE
ncbi:MAG: hypothetical protein M3410_16220 [Acidobacteriota bacterium]|nr:hypothetical protein [Acidobacteriota bacterium]